MFEGIKKSINSFKEDFEYDMLEEMISPMVNKLKKMLPKIMPEITQKTKEYFIENKTMFIIRFDPKSDTVQFVEVKESETEVSFESSETILRVGTLKDFADKYINEDIDKTIMNYIKNSKKQVDEKS